MSGSSLETVDLTRRFGEHLAVDSLELSVTSGEFFSLVGPSGCGKTTTLRMIAGLEEPTRGKILLGGRDVTAEPAHLRSVNTVFQHYALFPHLSVEENVAFGLRERRIPRAEIAKQVAEMLQLVDLPGHERARPNELSGGQQQRVALGRALILQPELLLLDEPLAALDFHLRRQMRDALKRIHREVGITFVLVTHDQEEAFSMADRVGVMRGGRLEQLGTPSEVYKRPANRSVAGFVGASTNLGGVVVSEPGPGHYDVELDAGLTIERVAGVAGLRRGDPVEITLRPEALVVHRADERGAPPPDRGFRGTVAEASYLGAQIVYTVETLAAGMISVMVLSSASRAFSRGDDVVVSWPEGAAWAVAADEKAGARRQAQDLTDALTRQGLEDQTPATRSERRSRQW